MPHEHKAYNITDDIFVGFIKNNRRWLDAMELGRIVDIVKAHEEKTGSVGPNIIEVCSIDVMEYPWHVKYIGKHGGGEGPFFVFLDESMNKLYSYYNVM
jgi:hypothetical protein